jgi:hypothetical protein
MLVKFPAVTAGAVQAVLPVPLGPGVGVGAIGVGVTGTDEPVAVGVAVGFGVSVGVSVEDGIVGVALTLRTGASVTEPLLHPTAAATATRAKKEKPVTRALIRSLRCSHTLQEKTLAERQLERALRFAVGKP